MKTINWSGYEWITQERWGEIHPAKSHWWYDDSKVYVDSDNVLHLETGYNPRYFEHLKTTAPIGAGLVSCTKEFSHGIFQIEAKLPTGYNLWPAFWMWSWNSWPPEIDVLEGYSDKSPSYEIDSPTKLGLFRKLFSKKRSIDKNFNVMPNVHYGNQRSLYDGLFDTFLRKQYRSSRSLTDSFNRYKLTWLPDKVEVEYNDTLMLALWKEDNVQSREVLDQLNKHTMNVIINNGVTDFANTDFPGRSDFQVKSFSYTPLRILN